MKASSRAIRVLKPAARERDLMADERRAQLELWRQERLKAKHAVSMTKVAIQRRVVVPPQRAETSQGAAGRTTALKRKAGPMAGTTSRTQRVKSSGSIASRTASLDSVATVSDQTSDAKSESNEPASSIEIREDSDFLPPSAEKLRKEKRRTSFILPSSSRVAALGGGAKRVLTPTKMTPPPTHETVTPVSAVVVGRDSLDGGRLVAPTPRRLSGVPVVDAPGGDDEVKEASPLPIAQDEDDHQTVEEAEAILDAVETETDTRSVRSTLSFGSIAGPLRVLQEEGASDDEDAFGDFTYPPSKSNGKKRRSSSIVSPIAVFKEAGAVTAPSSADQDSAEGSAVTRVSQSQKGPVRVLAPTLPSGNSLGAARRVSVGGGDLSGRRSLDEVKPALTLEERLNQHSKWGMDDFTVTKNLGKGKFGNVYLAKEKHTNVSVALKVLYKSPLILEGGLKNLQREVEIQHRLLHPNILRLHGYFYDDSCVYLVLEYASHGELYKLLSKQRCFSEAFASHYIAQVVDALEYLHSCHVIHRDIKPENLLMGASHTIKLADFGWSVHALHQYAKRNTFCGTPDYISPEVLLGEDYDHCVDVWSLGVLTYEFLFGTTPFHVDNQVEMYKRIESVDFQFPIEPAVSESARRFIAGLLQRNPADRMSLEQAREHEWLAKRPSI